MADFVHPTRRDLLIGLAALVPAPLIAVSATRAQGDDVFLSVSRTLTGNADLSPEVAARIEGLLVAREDRFVPRLTDLSTALRGGGITREEMLGALPDAQVEFALEIAKPWYLGYVGHPSDTILQDDAEFATFLEGQAWEKIIDQVPRPTYPGRAGGWWDAPPPAVAPPDMPAAILDWTFHPGGPATILPPDPAWRDYATADHDDIAAARAARPAAAQGAVTGDE